VGLVCFALAAAAICHLKETFGIDLDFVEVGPSDRLAGGELRLEPRAVR
jgi:hypothetical protein